MSENKIRFHDLKMCDEEIDPTVGAGALGNEVVLRNILKYLPTETILSSCSLVNKRWNIQARTFIRDHRECRVTSGCRNFWHFFAQLDRMLGDMKVSPFNSIHIFVHDWNQKCFEEADMSSLTNLLTKFPLKFFSVHEMDPCSASVASAVLELIRHNSSVLQELEVRSRSIGNHGLCQGWQPLENFKKLTKLSIYQSSTIISPECAKKIIDSAPKLRAVHNNCLPMIRDNLIPQNMYGTLKRLTFKLTDVDLVETFAEHLDRLEELIVVMEFSTLMAASSRDRKAMELRWIRLCEKLLPLNSLTLCNLGMQLYPDSSQKLELPVLSAVKDFHLCVGGPESLNYIKSIDFCGTFPNLCHVYIHGCGTYDMEDMIDMAAVSASQTTKELDISGDSFTSATDLVIFRRLFPNVVKFSIEFDRDCEPQRLIANLWPGLQSLRISAVPCLRNELDAEIFGLQPAELEFLRHKDQEFLEQVNVPPIRPCVSTLKELEHFQVHHLYGLDEETCRKFYEMVDTLIIGRRPDWNFKAQPERRMITPRFGDLWEEDVKTGLFFNY